MTTAERGRASGPRVPMAWNSGIPLQPQCTESDYVNYRPASRFGCGSHPGSICPITSPSRRSAGATSTVGQGAIRWRCVSRIECRLCPAPSTANPTPLLPHRMSKFVTVTIALGIPPHLRFGGRLRDRFLFGCAAEPGQDVPGGVAADDLGFVGVVDRYKVFDQPAFEPADLFVDHGQDAARGTGSRFAKNHAKRLAINPSSAAALSHIISGVAGAYRGPAV